MRVLVCGGRSYGVPPRGATAEQLAQAQAERTLAHETLYALRWQVEIERREVLTVIEGGANGADRLAARFANFYQSVEHEPYPADWTKYGKAAGFIRNQQMLDEGKPDLVIAFPGGRGTADMVARARKAGIEVRVIS